MKLISRQTLVRVYTKVRELKSLVFFIRYYKDSKNVHYIHYIAHFFFFDYTQVPVRPLLCSIDKSKMFPVS